MHSQQQQEQRQMEQLMQQIDGLADQFDVGEADDAASQTSSAFCADVFLTS